MRNLIATAILIGLGFPAQADAGVRTFFQPMVNGARVDACLGTGNCGKPAADAFCRTEGFDKALIFERQSVAATLAIDTGRRCTGARCTAFRQVKCFSTKSDLAALAF